MTNSSAAAHDHALFCRLADGRRHDADELAAELCISRDEVIAAVDRLAQAGLLLTREPGGRFCLNREIELLQAEQIEARLSSRARSAVQAIDVLGQVDSTNAWLLGQTACAAGRGRACLAELQTAGRGRRGRQWLAPPGGSLCLSLAWHFPGVVPDISSISLACGIAVVRVLEGLGLSDLGLKWPNDLVWRGHKFGGLLLEVRAGAGSGIYVVIGLGLNLHLGSLAGQIQTGWGGSAVDLAGIAPGRLPGRNALAAVLLNALTDILEEFSRHGFASLQAEWERLDTLRGRMVSVTGEGEEVTGTAVGVDAAGALKLMVDGKIQRIVAGEISVRPEHATAD